MVVTSASFIAFNLSVSETNRHASTISTRVPRIMANVLPTTIFAEQEEWLFIPHSDPRFSEARRARCEEALAQIVPPCQRDAGSIKS
jgi:hypothetical protein